MKVKINLKKFLDWLYDDGDMTEEYITCLMEGCIPYAETIKTTDEWNNGCYRNYTHIENLEEVLPYFNKHYEDKDYDDCNIFSENLEIEWV